MTIALSFLNDLWRVRIALSALTDVDAVKVERAFLTADPPWETVRGGVTLPVTAGAAQLDDYEYADATLNHYRVTRALPAPGLQLPGTSGNYASTPDTAVLDIVGDIELQIDATFAEGDIGAFRALISKYLAAGDQRSWVLQLTTTNNIQLAWTTAGTLATLTSMTTTQALSLEDGERIAIRVILDVNDGAGGRIAYFYTAPTIDGPWTLFETVTDVGTTSIHSGSANVNITGTDNGTLFPLEGVVHAAKIISDPFGTPVEVANPDFPAEADSTVSFADDAGRTWTINGTAEILTGNVLETDSITPDNGGLTILKSIKYPALNRSIGVAPAFRPVQMASRTGVYNIKGRVPPIGVHDAWTSEWWTMEFVTESLAQLRDLKLCIQASKTLFVQTPPEIENECFTNPVSGMPGGYVYALNATMTQAVPGSSTTRWVLPVRIIAPPGPEIAGTLLNWETVKRLYGSWTALWASNPTWRDVWNQIMDPEDAVVL
jgi:hypothetical protein